MIAETTTESNALQAAAPTEADSLALITLKPEAYATEVYAPFKDRLKAAIESVRNIDYDATTTKGLEVVTKARRLMADIRIDANKERVARKAPITQIGRLLESHYDAVEAAVLPMETLFDADIKAEETRKEEVKKSKLAEEAARVQGIADRISAITKLALKTARMSAAEISDVQAELMTIQIDDSFAEFTPNARTAWNETMEVLSAAQKAASDAEAEVERKRLAAEEETRKAAKERAELEAQRKEQERIANEQAAERLRLANEAAALEAVAAETRRKAEENLRAEAAAQTQRMQAEADARALEHAAAMKKLADERAAFEAAQKVERDKQVAQHQAECAAAELEVAHIEALAMDAAFDKEAQQVLVDPEVPQPAEDITELMDSIQDAEPTDEEIIAAYIENFGGTPEQAIERLARFAATVAG